MGLIPDIAFTVRKPAWWHQLAKEGNALAALRPDEAARRTSKARDFYPLAIIAVICFLVIAFNVHA